MWRSAFLNYVGERLCPDEWRNERAFFAGSEYRGTLGKLRLLLERAGVAYDKGARPYQTIAELDRRRDALVHARHEVYDREVTFKHVSELKSTDPAIYDFADAAFLGRAFADAEALCDAIEVAAQHQLGEFGQLAPYAFRGMISAQGGSIIAMPG